MSAWRRRLAETGPYLWWGRVTPYEAQHTQVLHLVCPLPVKPKPFWNSRAAATWNNMRECCLLSHCLWADMLTQCRGSNCWDIWRLDTLLITSNKSFNQAVGPDLLATSVQSGLGNNHDHTIFCCFILKLSFLPVCHHHLCHISPLCILPEVFLPSSAFVPWDCALSM